MRKCIPVFENDRRDPADGTTFNLREPTLFEYQPDEAIQHLHHVRRVLACRRSG